MHAFAYDDPSVSLYLQELLFQSKKMFDLAYMDLDQNDSVRNNIFSCSAKPIEFCILLGNATPVKSRN